MAHGHDDLAAAIEQSRSQLTAVSKDAQPRFVVTEVEMAALAKVKWVGCSGGVRMGLVSAGPDGRPAGCGPATSYQEAGEKLLPLRSRLSSPGLVTYRTFPRPCQFYCQDRRANEIHRQLNRPHVASSSSVSAISDCCSSDHQSRQLGVLARSVRRNLVTMAQRPRGSSAGACRDKFIGRRAPQLLLHNKKTSRSGAENSRIKPRYLEAITT
jgi:hypothetical protein